MAAFAIEAARWSSPVVLALVMVDRAHLDLTAHRPDGDVSLELDSRVLDGVEGLDVAGDRAPSCCRCPSRISIPRP